MTKTFLTAAVLAAATFATGAYAQSYDQDGSSMQASPQQQYDSTSSQSQYYNYQGDQTSSPAAMQESGQNGQYIERKSYEVPNGRPNNYARELKDGPMGTSPGA
ncbi:hypothetical protein [Herbaspirillum sp. C9C3]|uniref:hypothetical protein n=1 Tax=Herbaspirillum sp. C9C3 TaxID=2735271 RepID=UPI00158504CC|nr:hypothetical protein [Herbaspirillum sp. C9C3]NUT62034.1 hypothetical protein [Herbaspirillum sp. C9C3]